MKFSRQEYWSGLPFPSPGDLLDTGIELGLLHDRQSPALQKDCLRLSHQAKLLKDSFSGLLCSYMWHTSNQVLMDTFGREFWKVSINKNTKSGRKLLSSLLLPGMWMWWLTLQQTPASWSYHKDGSYTPGSWPKKQKTWLFFFFFNSGTTTPALDSKPLDFSYVRENQTSVILDVLLDALELNPN